MTTYVEPILSGTIILWAGVNSPNNTDYVLCDGSSFERTATLYSKLFSIIGTAFTSDVIESTKFQVPNLQGVTIVGASLPNTVIEQGLTPRLLKNSTGKNSMGGTEKVILTETNLPAHNHGGGDHTHSYQTRTVTGKKTIGVTQSGFVGGGEVSATTNSVSPIVSQGGDQAHNNLQPYITLYYYIKL